MIDKELTDPEKVIMEIKLLSTLYADPEPGLVSWCMIERERLQTVFNLLHKNGFRPTKEITHA